MTLSSLSVLALVIGLSAVSAQKSSGFGSVVSALSQLQTSDGGFRLNSQRETSLEATAYALSLYSLYGLKGQIQVKEALSFVKDRQNGDGGFAASRGAASDIESVHHAVYSYLFAGEEVDGASEIASYVKSLVDKNSGLFSSAAGQGTDLKSTALAVDVLVALKEFDKWDESSDVSKAIIAYLKNHLVSDEQGTYFAFPEEEQLPLVSANYYGIDLAVHVGFALDDVSGLVKFILGLQSTEKTGSKRGGLYTDLSKAVATHESTAHGVFSLRILGGKTPVYVDKLNTKHLVEYLRIAPRDLKSAALANLAFACANQFSDVLQRQIVLDSVTGPIGDFIVQGTSLKPTFAIFSFGEVPHGGFSVSAKITLSTGQSSSYELAWNPEDGRYVGSDSFATTGHLGSVKFSVSSSTSVPGPVGVISFSSEETKSIGYQIAIRSSSTSGGKAVQSGDSVGLDSSFKFDIRLSSRSEDNIISGPFHVKFSVLDSSRVAAYSKSLDCSRNAAPLSFSYVLDSASIPAGALSFLFEVDHGNGAHSTASQVFNFVMPMVASEASISESSVKLGQTLTVSMSPGSLPSPAKFIPFSFSKDSSTRKFSMDVVSQGGAILTSVDGDSSADEHEASSVSFSFTVPESLEFIGSFSIQFKYVPAVGDAISLSYFDSASGEVQDEAASLKFSVSADLRVVDLADSPSEKSLTYGSEIKYKFKVVDAVSGKNVGSGSMDEANVFLLVQNVDAASGKPMVAAKVAARVAGDKTFSIQWTVNPNAEKGAASLALAAFDSDGNTLKLVVGDSGKAYSFQIDIGGEISVSTDFAYSISNDVVKSVFAVSFSLVCAEKKLPDAQLKGTVMFSSGSEFVAVAGLVDIPVANNDIGSYEVSWALPHKDAPSGKYRLDLFREIDRLKAADSNKDAAPFISIDLSHTNNTSMLKVRMDFISLLLLGLAWRFISQSRAAALKRS